MTAAAEAEKARLRKLELEARAARWMRSLLDKATLDDSEEGRSAAVRLCKMIREHKVALIPNTYTEPRIGQPTPAAAAAWDFTSQYEAEVRASKVRHAEAEAAAARARAAADAERIDAALREAEQRKRRKVREAETAARRQEEQAWARRNTGTGAERDRQHQWDEVKRTAQRTIDELESIRKAQEATGGTGNVLFCRDCSSIITTNPHVCYGWMGG